MQDQVKVSKGVTTFQPKKITFPNIQCNYKRDMDNADETRLLYKLSVEVLEDKMLALNVGVLVRTGKFFDEEKNSFKDESFLVIAESFSIFIVDGIIPQMKSVLDFPMIASMGATVYPFLKEKVTSLLGSNHVAYYLPSFNISAFIKTNSNQIVVSDKRF